jgi:hypothetical protein
MVLAQCPLLQDPVQHCSSSWQATPRAKQKVPLHVLMAPVSAEVATQ